jgi:hypothetical protein
MLKILRRLSQELVGPTGATSIGYKPKPATYDNSMTGDLGYLPTEFEPFEPNPEYSFTGRRPPSKNAWKTVVPKTAPPIGNLPHLIEKVIKATWKFAEPSADSVRGPVTIGTRGGAVPEVDEKYHP